MKKVALAASTLVLLLAPQGALAHVSCQGTLNASYMTFDGSVIIRGSWRNDYTQICNLKTEWKGVTPDVCAGWKAMADAALSMGRQLSLYYGESFACTAIPYYGDAPRPYYVMLL